MSEVQCDFFEDCESNATNFVTPSFFSPTFVNTVDNILCSRILFYVSILTTSGEQKIRD